MLIGIVVLLAVLLVLPGLAMAGEGPVFRPDVEKDDVDRLQKEMALVLALPDAEIVRMIPARSGFRFVGCPNCEGGAEENQITWRIDRPDEVFCQFCEMVFPNEQYPENGVMRVQNALGEVQEYAYWEGSEAPPKSLPGSLSHVEKDKKYRHYFWAKGWYTAREFFSDAAWKLGQLYYATGDRVYAERAALILDQFAQVYPGYCARYDSPF
ncbi:MAG: heparinase, partial [bacterium]|nr:heparinase [bacterium]